MLDVGSSLLHSPFSHVLLALPMLLSNVIMAAVCRPHIFVIFFQHRQRGPLVGWLKVSCQPGGQWQTQWDIGTIDRDPRLSDDWFCRDEYEKRFGQMLQAAADKCAQFKLPGATSRWGRAMGMPHRNAVDLAHQVQALWQEILLDWEAGGCVGEETQP
jgi:hypothetical protein